MKPTVHVLLVAALAALVPACSTAGDESPSCGRSDNRWVLVVTAQAVPSAAYVPCIGALPAGWRVSESRLQRGSFSALLDSDRAGMHAAEIRLTRGCDVADAVEIPMVDAPAGVRTFERPVSLSPAFVADRFVTFEGGCVTYAFRFAGGASAALALEVQQAVDLVPRAELRRFVAGYGLELCGAGAPPCPG